jgi:predicted O-methyltransferase YrrM
MKNNIVYPKKYNEILNETLELGFNQLSDENLGALLSTLVSSKRNSKILELGTGSGLSTSWILDGMDENSLLLTVDNDEILVNIAKKYLKNDKRVQFFIENGEDLILRLEPNSIDFIFADNWPEGHEEKVNNLIQFLENRKDLNCVKLDWATGIIICTKKQFNHKNLL